MEDSLCSSSARMLSYPVSTRGRLSIDLLGLPLVLVQLSLSLSIHPRGHLGAL